MYNMYNKYRQFNTYHITIYYMATASDIITATYNSNYTIISVTHVNNCFQNFIKLFIIIIRYIHKFAVISLLIKC